MPNINDVSLATTSLAGLTGSKFTTTAYSSSTAAAGDLSGAVTVHCINTGGTPGTLTTRTALQMIADSNLQSGQRYTVILANAQATGTLTLAGGTGVTISGTATVAGNTARIFDVNVTSGSAITFTNVAGGIVSP